MTTIEWRLLRPNAGDAVEPNLFDLEVTDAVNRFGRSAVAYVDDVEGTDAWANYPRGTAVELEYSTDGGSTFTRRFAGWVAERRRANQSGAEVLEIEIYSYDHFLRRNQVTRTFSSKAISTILEDIIKDFTPVSWASGNNVTVVNDETITRDFQGERVDNALSELALTSANEEYGANDDNEFFFQARETTRSPRDIDNTQWLSHDIPEKGKSAVNEVQVFYGPSGNRDSIIVRDGADQQDLQDRANAAGPVTFREEITREDITDQSVARRKGEEVLNDRAETLSGTVTTYELFDAEPGDLINITIEPRDLDDEFRIAEIEYRWGDDETIVSIVENRGAGQDDTLVRITDTLKRVEQRAADRTVTATQFEGPLLSQALLTVTVTVTARDLGDTRFQPGFGRDEIGFGRGEPGFSLAGTTSVSEIATVATNNLLDALRDAWSGGSAPDISTVSIGTDASTDPARSDTSLGSRLFDISATASEPSTTKARFDAGGTMPSTATIAECGLELSGQTLHARATVSDLSAERAAPVDVRIEIEINDDADTMGVITTVGQRVIRDIVTNNTPDTVAAMLFGTDGTDASVSDTALGTQVGSDGSPTFEDQETGTVDVVGTYTNSSNNSQTLKEWGLENSSSELLHRITIADLVLEDGNTLTGRQRNRFRND